MRVYDHIPNIEATCWTLISAEATHQKSPKSFEVPSFKKRSTLERGMAAMLLFKIVTYSGGIIFDEGIDRMWVVVTSILNDGYQGVLDSNPGFADGLELAKGDIVFFHAEHVCNIERPPAEFLREQLGAYFSDF